MNSTYQACLPLGSSIRGSSMLLVLVVLFGCSDQGQEQSVATEQKAAPLTTAAPITSSTTENIDTSDSSIEITIEMGVPDEVMGELLASSRLFVIAKSAASPMPLAVKAFPIDVIPSNLSLSDADAMMPNRLLSSADQLIVTARISRAGGAIRASGDWEGTAADPTPEKPRQYHIRIDQPVN